jgi:hypothetical protein
VADRHVCQRQEPLLDARLPPKAANTHRGPDRAKGEPVQEQYPYQRVPGSQPTAFGQSPASAVHWLLPTGRSWQAIAAGYVALLAIVIWPLGPVALGLGIWALRQASRQRSHGRGRAVFAVAVGVLATVMLIAVVTTL